MAFEFLGANIQKRLAIGGAMILLVVFVLSVFGYFRSEPTADKPRIGLMTTLPLRWAEGNMATTLDPATKPSAAYSRLAEHYKVDLIDTPRQLNAAKIGILVLAQPRAFSPSELVELDNWVRRGGRLLVFADPALAWESDYPLGDKRRPLFTSLLSPLFAHWGVELVLPMDGSKAAEVRKIGQYSVRMPTPGAWQLAGAKADATCSISPDYLVAECRVGKGRAKLVADADLLDAQRWQGTDARAVMGWDDFANMEWVLLLIESLRRL